jgi:signal transduction histidine kinase
METYFAKAEKADKNEIIREIEIVNKNPVMTGLLHSVSGLLAILDEHRQIVALNDSFMKMLGIDDPSECLKLRPGEALRCIHADEEPAGCGTTRFCSSCGAAIAIVSSLGQDKSVERICLLSAKKADATIDLALLVRSHPIRVNGKRFLLLFLQDITLQQQRAALERTFFHDISNMLNGIVGASELLALKDSKSNVVKIISQLSLRLQKEVEIQRCLLENNHHLYQPVLHEIMPEQVIEELESFFANHPANRNKKLIFSVSGSSLPFKTDFSLLVRILCNMITNALEATNENGVVKVWYEQKHNLLSFYVWNDKMISQDITLRIFQRNFSTKGETGRGIGTYSMKLFGEKILGGKVSLTSSREQGTVFEFSLPFHP